MQVRDAILEVMQADLKSARPVRNWRPLELGQAVHKRYPQMNESTVRSQLSRMFDAEPGLLIRCSVTDKHGSGWEYKLSMAGGGSAPSGQLLSGKVVEAAARMGAYDAAKIPSMKASKPSPPPGRIISESGKARPAESHPDCTEDKCVRGAGEGPCDKPARNIAAAVKAYTEEIDREARAQSITVRDHLRGQLERLRKESEHFESVLSSTPAAVLDMSLEDARCLMVALNY